MARILLKVGDSVDISNNPHINTITDSMTGEVLEATKTYVIREIDENKVYLEGFFAAWTYHIFTPIITEPSQKAATSNYLQIKELTNEEKFEMYNKLDKGQIINMLIQANNIIELIKSYVPTYELNSND